MRPKHAWTPLMLGAMALLCQHSFAGAAPVRDVGPLHELASPADSGSAEPRLAVAPSGRVFMSWLEKRPGGRHRLRMSWLSGERWSASTTIAQGDSFFANWADFPGVVALDDRRMIAYWLWKVGGHTYAYHVRSARSLDGGKTWSKPITVHRDTSPTEHGFVSVAPIAGGATAVWLDGHNFKGHSEEEGPGPDMAVHAATLTNSAVQQEQQIDPRACDCCQTAAVATSRGVLVAYRDRSPEEIRDISLARFEDGRWTAPYALHSDGWHINGCPVNGPVLAASGREVIAAWFTGARDTARVNVAFSSDGGESFGAPIRVDLGQPTGRVGVALMEDNTGLVTWLEGAGEEAGIRIRRVARDGAMSKPSLVGRASVSRATGVPQLVVTKGRVIAAWTDATKPSRVRLVTGKAE